MNQKPTQIKTFYIILIAFFSSLTCTKAWGETVVTPDPAADSPNICANFTSKKKAVDTNNAPPPVRNLNQLQSNNSHTSITEEIFYQQLGLVSSKDGSYICMVTDPNNNLRQFTLFKVQKINNVLVASTFLDQGEFLAGQKQAISDLFLEIIQFYTDLPATYYPGVKNYFREFYLRMADGRLNPSSDRVYAVDEPSSTVIMYHPSQGEFEGTVISLNISLL